MINRKMKLSRLPIITLVLFTAFLFHSCTSSDSETYTPDYAGSVNEIYIFCESSIWNDTIGSYLRDELQQDLTNMPQPEERFTLFQFDPDAMNKSRRTHRNIIEVEINDRNENKETRLVRNHDFWAKTQLRYKFKGQQTEKVLALIRAELPGIIDEINTLEIERYHKKFKERPNTSAQRKLKEERGINLTIPKKLMLQDNTENFAWMEARGLGPEGKRVLHQGVFVYHYPYVDTNTFTYEYLINKRNEVLKRNVPGATDDQYLTTLMIPGDEPEIREINFNGEFAIEMRGQYTMRNGYMGGPFVSVTTLDRANNQIVTVEGYCYAPLMKKRDYLKEMEAVVYSTTFERKEQKGTN